MPDSLETRPIVSLTGDWQLSFPSKEQPWTPGLKKPAWPPGEVTAIHVPGIWNIKFPDQTGAGYYRKVFELPGSWADGVILLKCLGASYRAEAWLNGIYLGSHEGIFTPFCFDATPAAIPGAENELIVRVTSLSKTTPIEGMALHQSPASKQNWHYVFGGLWGEIYLERSGWVSCESIQATPNLRQEEVVVDLRLNNRTPNACPLNLSFTISQPDGTPAYTQSSPIWVNPTITRFQFKVHIPHPVPWSCANPFLYRVQVTLSDQDGTLDQAGARFGMRDFTVSNGQFYLNEEPIFIRGILLQPNYPIGLVAPTDPDMVSRDLHLAKEAGFNLIRVHIRPPVPGFLDLADELGILVYEESSLAWIRDSPRMSDHCRRELAEMIERDHNHPSVVIWGVYNENPPAAALNSEELARYIRTLDTSRVVVHNSGGSLAIDQDFGWIDQAMILPNRSILSEPIQDVHVYFGGLVSDPAYDWLRDLGSGVSAGVLAQEGFGSAQLMAEYDHDERSYQGHFFFSELGFGGIANLDDTVAMFSNQTDLLDARELISFQTSMNEGFAARKLDLVFGSTRELYDQAQNLQGLANRRQVEALLCNPRVSGYVLTQLNDVSFECNSGIVDLWRRPKPAYEAFKQLNQPRCLIIRTDAPAIEKGGKIHAQIWLFSQKDLQRDVALSLTLFDPYGESTSLQKRITGVKKGCQHIVDITLDARETTGEYRLEGSLSENGDRFFQTSQKILVVDPVSWEDVSTGVTCVGDLSGPLIEKNIGRRFDGQYIPGSVLLAAHPSSLTIRDWEALLESTEKGSTTILGELLPNNQVAFDLFAERGIPVKVSKSMGSWIGCNHWISDSAPFTGLPSRGIAAEGYRTVVPHYSLGEMGGLVLAGAFWNSQSMSGPSVIEWYSDLEIVPLGRGKVVFCQYRIFDRYAFDPVARRLVYNLLRHGSLPA